MTRRRAALRVRGICALALMLAGVLGVPGAGPAGAELRQEGWIWDGVLLRDRAEAGPVRAVELHVSPDAHIRFQTLVSGERVDGGREVVSGMCHRAGGVACVNAHFSLCPTCDQPFGGIVRDGIIMRTPTDQQNQVSVVHGRFSVDPWPWSAGLIAPDAPGRPVLEIDGINIGDVPGGIVLRNRDYGDNTRAAPGGHEVALGAPQPLTTGLGVRHPVRVLGQNGDGSTRIDVGAMVLTGTGVGAERLREWVQAYGNERLELMTNVPAGLEQSFAGHPVLLRDGVPQAMDPADGKVADRHPRTLLGWNDAGSVWVAVIDGRQAHSRGMTLYEATQYLQDLGATDGVNLDGGGSSAMVSVCPSETGWCLRNAPSGGHERAVTTALALIPVEPPPAPAPDPELPPDPEPAPQVAAGSAGPAPGDLEVPQAEIDAAAAAAPAPPPEPVVIPASTTTTTTSTTTTVPPPTTTTTTIASPIAPAPPRDLAAPPVSPEESSPPALPVGLALAAVTGIWAASLGLLIDRRRRMLD